MSILTFLTVGLVTGFVTGKIIGGTGHGLIGDLVVATVGSFLGGFVLGLLGITGPVLYSAIVGSILLVTIVKTISKK